MEKSILDQINETLRFQYPQLIDKYYCLFLGKNGQWTLTDKDYNYINVVDLPTEFNDKLFDIYGNIEKLCFNDKKENNCTVVCEDNYVWGPYIMAPITNIITTETRNKLVNSRFKKVDPKYFAPLTSLNKKD